MTPLQQLKEKKKPKWRKIFDIEYPDYGTGKISVYDDWISYTALNVKIGFNPETSIKDVLKDKENELKAIKFAYSKWLEEFKNKK